MSGAGQVEPGRLSLRVDGTTLEQRGTEHTPEEVYVAPRRMRAGRYQKSMSEVMQYAEL